MKTYFLKFGDGDPRNFCGLNATFLMFKLNDNTNVTPPGITQVGSSSGIYYFNWGTTTPICFLADAATTSPGASGRYVTGSIDPNDRCDEYGTTITAIGTTLVAIGTTNFALGTTNFALGTTNVAIGASGVALGTTNVALGTSIIAQGTTILSYLSGLSSPVLIAIGSTASSFGSTSSDPVDLFGYLKRIIELYEGNETFAKSTGALSMYSRGSSTLLRQKTVTNSTVGVTKI